MHKDSYGVQKMTLNCINEFDKSSLHPKIDLFLDILPPGSCGESIEVKGEKDTAAAALRLLPPPPPCQK